MNKKIEQLKAEIDQLLKQAEQVDAEEAAALGSRRGDELPDELKRARGPVGEDRGGEARLEAEARAKAEEEQRRRDEEQAQREAKAAPAEANNPLRSTPSRRISAQPTSPTPRRES